MNLRFNTQYTFVLNTRHFDNRKYEEFGAEWCPLVEGCSMILKTKEPGGELTLFFQ